MGISFSVHRRAACCHSSTRRGRTKSSAGPPILYHVYGASATFSSTISCRPAKGSEWARRIVMDSVPTSLSDKHRHPERYSAKDLGDRETLVSPKSFAEYGSG